MRPGNHDDDDADDLLRREWPPSLAASSRAVFTADMYQNQELTSDVSVP